MKDFDPKNAETSFACWGMHVGLTILLTVCLAAYDGLEHSYPIAIGYMFIGWVIPFALWPYVKKLVSRPVSPIKSNINIYGPWIVLMGLGTLFFLLSLFMPSTDSITVNGETITKADPRFAHEELMFRVQFGGMGLVFAIAGYFVFRYIRKRRNNQEQKLEQ